MTGIILAIIVAFFVAAGIISYITALYNGLVRAKNNLEKAFNNIDVLLQQRHDELPKLVDAAKGYMKHERDLLTDIVKQRMKYRKADGMGAKIATENKLADLLGRFNVLVEQYPDLKAIEAFNHLQLRISGVEGQIADRRELFNDSTNIYNIRIEQFPDFILARLLQYERQAYLKVPEENKEDVKLDLPN
ncbi:LemA protein [Olavius sp. associated proteobacterium Delta 1]|nr:LemA protein [Olavius sp. associated proteobacterium Delta 1]